MEGADREAPPAPIRDDADRQVTGQRQQGSPLVRLLPWLLGLFVVCFAGLVVLGACQALIGSGMLARATPTPAFLAGTEVKLVGPEGGSISVWQMDIGCQRGDAFGEVPPGSDARTLDEVCYRREDKELYHRIELANGSSGWVAGGELVRAAEYTPPSPTETPEPTGTPRPTGTPWPTPTPPPTQTPTPAPLPPGSPLSLGNWAIRVDQVESADALSTPAGDRTVQAEGRFALVYLTATNQGPRPETLHASSVYIEDAEGNHYGNHDTASAYASSEGCPDFALDVASGDSVCLVAAIDLSPGSSFYLLGLQGAEDRVLLDVP